MSTLAELKAALADVNEQIVTLTVKKEEIETQVKELESKEADEALNKIVGELKALNLAPEAIAKALGIRIAEPEQKKARAARGTATPKVKGVPKYRSLVDPSLTWAGKGPRPAWVKDHLAGNGKLEDLLIIKE